MNKNLIILFIVVAVVIIGGYNLLSGPKQEVQNNTSNAPLVSDTVATTNQDQIMISVDAKRWQFTPDIINIKKGQKVKIIINNTDTIHGINLPEFNVIGDNSIEFIAYKTGTFPFFCKNFCGGGHKDMIGKIIVTD